MNELDIYKPKIQDEGTQIDPKEAMYRDAKEEKIGFMGKLRNYIANSKAGKYAMALMAAGALYASDMTKPNDANALRIEPINYVFENNLYKIGWYIYLDSNDKLFHLEIPYEGNENTDTSLNNLYEANYDPTIKILKLGSNNKLNKYELWAITPFDGKEKEFTTVPVNGWVSDGIDLYKFNSQTISLQPKEPAQPVPEPSTLLLLASGAGAILPWARNKKNK